MGTKNSFFWQTLVSRTDIYITGYFNDYKTVENSIILISSYPPLQPNKKVLVSACLHTIVICDNLFSGNFDVKGKKNLALAFSLCPSYESCWAHFLQRPCPHSNLVITEDAKIIFTPIFRIPLYPSPLPLDLQHLSECLRAYEIHPSNSRTTGCIVETRRSQKLQ
jgi:hypothetical protein